MPFKMDDWEYSQGVWWQVYTDKDDLKWWDVYIKEANND